MPLKNNLNQRLLKSSAANSLSIIARIGNQLLIIPILITGWSVGLFGEWVILSAVPVFLAMSDFGFIAAGSNELAKKASQETKENVQNFYDRYSVYFQRWSLLLAFILIFIAFTVPFNQLMGLKLISPEEASYIFLFLSLGALVSQNSLSLLAGLRVQGKFHIGLLIRACSAITQIYITWLFVYVFETGPVEVSVSYLSLSIITYVVEWLFLKRAGLSQKVSPLKSLIQGEPMKPYFLMGMEMMLMPFAQAITLQGSVILIGKLLDPISTAIYVTHRTLSRTSSSLLQVFSNPLRAEAGMLQKEEDKRLLTETTSLLSRITFWMALLVSFTLMTIGSWIFSIWTAGEILFHSELFIILLIAVIAEALWRIPTALRLGTNRHRPVAWGYLIFSAIGLLIASMLSENYGILGIAVGITIIDVAMMILAIWTLKGVVDITVSKFVLDLAKPPIKEISQLVQKVLKKGSRNAN